MELVADNQVLTGNISVDSISNINMTLKNNSTFNGMISIVPNVEGGEKYKTNADVFIAAGSTWNLTGNSNADKPLQLRYDQLQRLYHHPG